MIIKPGNVWHFIPVITFEIPFLAVSISLSYCSNTIPFAANSSTAISISFDYLNNTNL